jgi:hypothetical protein
MSIFIMYSLLQRPDETIRILMPKSVAETLKLRLGLPDASAAKLAICMQQELPKIPTELTVECLLRTLPLESAKEYMRQCFWCAGSERDDYKSDLTTLIKNLHKFRN